MNIRLLFLAALMLLLCACQQMGPTQVGVRFRKLPSGLGPVSLGGVSRSILVPGQLAILMPWDKVYTFDTSVQDVSWPSTQAALEGGRKEGYVNTRALDGNEVALAVTVRYRIQPDSESFSLW